MSRGVGLHAYRTWISLSFDPDPYKWMTSHGNEYGPKLIILIRIKSY